MDMAYILCSIDVGSSTLFYSSPEETIHIYMNHLILFDFKSRSFFLKSLLKPEMMY